MAPGSALHFGPFALDGTDDGLWCGPWRRLGRGEPHLSLEGHEIFVCPRGAFEVRELRRQCTSIACRSIELWESQAARLVLLPLRTLYSSARDADCFALGFSDANCFVER